MHLLKAQRKPNHFQEDADSLPDEVDAIYNQVISFKLEDRLNAYV